MAREDVTFPSGDDHCAAWLYRPDEPSGATGARPIVVMAHGLGGVKEQRLDAFAERFVAERYLCLVFDYRHFGASGGEPRQLLRVANQRADWKAAVAFARTIDGADPDRVALWGTSFGGGHVIATAAGDRRIAAVIAQCPFTNGFASSRTIPLPALTRVSTRAVRDLVGSWFGREPMMVPVYGPPGSTALMNAPDVVAGIELLNPPGFEFRKDIAARFALDIVRAFPGRQAKNIACPTFLAICQTDTVAPPGPTRRYAAQVPDAEVKLYDAGHFDIYVGDDFERNVADQIDFLKRRLPVS